MTADDIRQLRRRTGLTQPGMAALVGVPLGTYRNWEQDIRSPTGKNVLALQRVARNVERRTQRNKGVSAQS